MQIRVAHLRLQGQSIAVFAADATAGSSTARSDVLARLARKARASGLRVDKAVLRFMEGGRITYFGSPDLVRYLANSGLHQWTHWIDD